MPSWLLTAIKIMIEPSPAVRRQSTDHKSGVPELYLSGSNVYVIYVSKGELWHPGCSACVGCRACNRLVGVFDSSSEKEVHGGFCSICNTPRGLQRLQSLCKRLRTQGLRPLQALAASPETQRINFILNIQTSAFPRGFLIDLGFYCRRTFISPSISESGCGSKARYSL